MERFNDKTIWSSDGTLRYDTLQTLCIESGADDVGFADVDRSGLQPQKKTIFEIFPETRSLISLAVFLNPENTRTPARNLTSFDVHLAEDILAMASRRIIMALRKAGVKGVYLPPVFPMDTSRPNPDALNLSLKPIAEEAGLGLMGVNRLVLHPDAGSSVWFATILIDRPLDRYDKKIPKNPCIDCKLCVAACPVGAIKSNGEFDWLPCLVHNYREVVVSFVDWVDALVASPDMDAYRKRFNDLETVSWWQSLAYRPTYQCNHCVGVCPAGENVGAEYDNNPAHYFNRVVKPLIERPQTVYVIKGSRAEEKAGSNPHKRVKTVQPPRL
ncbi:MAG: 4Fe-4S binding protein [Desulfobacterales bacterium]|nr:4Fe-4S binding protein [Desulfobacterales bacterium]